MGGKITDHFRKMAVVSLSISTETNELSVGVAVVQTRSDTMTG